MPPLFQMSELSPTQVDGKPTIVDIPSSFVKFNSTPYVVIAIACGHKEDNTIVTCPIEHGGCGAQLLLSGVRSPLLVPVRFMLATSHFELPLNAIVSTLVEAGRLCTEAKQIMTKEAIRLGAKYILYLDDDILAPTNGLYKLYTFMERNSEVGAIGGVCTTRQDPVEPIVYLEHGKGAWWDFPNKPAQVFAVGGGFLFARVSAIKDIIEKLKVENNDVEIPIWADEYRARTDTNNIEIMLGSDKRFCNLMNKYGYPVYVHGDVWCKHLDITTDTLYEMPNRSKDAKSKSNA